MLLKIYQKREEYQGMVVSLRPGMVKDRDQVLRELVDIQYTRNEMDMHRGCFRVHGDVIEVYPAQGGDYFIRIEFFGDEIDRIAEVEPLSGRVHAVLSHIAIFPWDSSMMIRKSSGKKSIRVRGGAPSGMAFKCLE